MFSKLGHNVERFYDIHCKLPFVRFTWWAYIYSIHSVSNCVKLILLLSIVAVLKKILVGKIRIADVSVNSRLFL